jgi:hypothetical protein
VGSTRQRGIDCDAGQSSKQATLPTGRAGARRIEEKAMMRYQTLLELRREERTRERTAATSFVQAVVDGDVNALSKAVAQVDVSFVWRPTLRALIRRSVAGSEELRLHFLDTYVARGNPIRQEVGDDFLVADALRLLLPVYQGLRLKLFRGESFFNRRRRSLMVR